MKGLQEGDDSRYAKAVSTCKHYAAYSVDGYKGMDRHHYNAVVDDRDLVETYLPAFKSCAQVKLVIKNCVVTLLLGGPSSFYYVFIQCS